MSSLRIIRNGATVTELNTPPETVALVQKIQRTVFENKSKNKYLKEVLGHSLCCLCRGIPVVEVSYDLLDGFRKVEYYCETCKESLYRKEPTDPKEVAAQFGCTIGTLPETPNYREGKEVIS